MAGFLRKKPKQDQRPKTASAAAPPPPPANATPLFAKFATTKQAQEGPRIVSSPMSLSSARKDAAAPPHNQIRGTAQAAVQSQRDAISRTHFPAENRREIPGTYSNRSPTRGAAVPLQEHVGTRTHDPRLQHPADNTRNIPTQHPNQSPPWGGAMPPPNSFGGMGAQVVVHPHSYDDTRPPKPWDNARSDPGQRMPNSNPHPPPQTRARPTSRPPMFDKPLPSPVAIPTSRPLSEEHASPIQGEYAHLWSMIAGEDTPLPDISERSPANPTTNALGNASAQEASRSSNIVSNTIQVSNSIPVPDLVVSDSSTLPVSSNVPPNLPPGARTLISPIASQQPAFAIPDFSSSSPSPPSDPSLPPRSLVNSAYSAASSSRTTLYFDDEGNSSEAHRSYANANNNEMPDIPEQSFASPPNVNRKLSQSTKPVGQPHSITRSPSAAHRDGNRPESSPLQPAQDERRISHRPPSAAMGANISAPDVSGVHHMRTPYNGSPILAPNGRSVDVSSPAHASAPHRMSVQYTSAPAITSPPRKSSSMRSATGKPLIFTAMAAIDQKGGPIVKGNPALSTPPVVQYRNWPNAAPPPQQQYHSPPQAAMLLPPRKESVRPYPLPPQVQPPSQQLRPQPSATITPHGHQAAPTVMRPPSSTSQNIVPVPTPPVKRPPVNRTPPPQPHNEPAPPLRHSPSRTRRPQPSIDQSAASPNDQYQRNPAKVLPTPPMTPGKAGPIQIDGDALGVPLDEDPFAKVEGVKMLMPTVSRPPSPTGTEGTGKRGKSRDGRKDGEELNSDSGSFEPSRPASSAHLPLAPSPMSSDEEVRRANGKGPVARAREDLVMVAPPTIRAEPGDPDCLTGFLGDVNLLSTLLGFFSFYEWCMILSLSREIRFMIVQNPILREAVLERFLKTVGYTRWAWNEPDPLSLSLQDLNDYMRGVSTPTHEYARIAALYNHSLYVHPSHRDHSLYDTVRALSASTRAYTRVVLRLRAQGEKEAAIARSRGPLRNLSRPSSRAPSPTFTHSNNSHASMQNSQQSPRHAAAVSFQSPLFRLKRAPLLRVFVPSPDGDWLSDKSVLECEAECRRAGVMGLMRLGDVVWDVAVGDEGNVGRLVWDGSYLIDLDYTYSPIGDLPKYMPTLAFPPSYFHRVIRTGPNSSNPIVHIDLRPWGEEIAANLQLLQDRVRTETPQGAYHNVVRWVHRSSFVIRPPGRGTARSPMSANHHPPTSHPGPPRVPIPDFSLFVDPGWYGTIVVETEGTNESLADLQDRCGPGAFPPRPSPVNGVKATDREGKLVFRILREKSRPGEIWIRAVSSKERLL